MAAVATALYMRLSREDKRTQESESIGNQRLLLRQYAEKHGLVVHYEYTDDGISGTTQNRKGLQGLFQAIEAGLVQVVLIKDLSRLSRNYLHTGTLIEEWFPQHGVRLISVDDNIDTGNISPSNDMFAFRAVLDDWYARDISRKVRAAIAAKQCAGFCTCASLPFGYDRYGQEVRVDHAKANIIRQIYDSYESGNSCCRIASLLRVQLTKSANTYYLLWNDATIRRILMNPAYIGRLQLHKTKKFSYKSCRKISLPESEYITYPVPPIITIPQFLKVQELILKNGHKGAHKHWLCGLVFCAACGAPMHISGDEMQGRIICSTRKRFQSCTVPSLRCSVLLDEIKSVFKQDGIPFIKVNYRNLIKEIRISSDTILIRMKYKPGKSNNSPD